jgi:excisionase family DNA binding protein
MVQTIDERLTHIENLLLSQKKVLNLDEVAVLTGLSKSHLYKLTSNGKIPHYKPGKFIFFERAEIEDWLLRNRIKTVDEIEAEAASYVTSKNGRAGK